MSLRPLEIEEVASELTRELGGAFVQKVFSPSSRRLYLEIRIPGRSVLVLVCTEPEVARLSVADERVASPPQASPYQSRARAELIGKKLVSVRSPSPREVMLLLEHEGVRRTVFAELGGRGDLVLMDEEGRGLAAGERRFLLPRAPGQREAEPAAPAQESRLHGLSEPFALARAAEALYAEREQALRLKVARAQVVQPLRTKLARMERTVGKVRDEASRGPKAEEHQRVGTLLSQNLFRLQRGAKEVTLTEYTEEGERQVTVRLDPSRSPKDEAEWHFHQYRRLTRGVEQARKRLVELEAELARTRGLLERALQEQSAEKLEDEAGPAPTSGRTGAPPQVHQPFVEYRTKRGERILVGRGGADNDELTFKIARPQDLWLHARGVTGAHVVVPLERNQVVGTDLLLDAAHLALHHAKTKGEAGGEVSYVLAKFVKRPKGGAPGAVIYTREKTFWVRLEPERLATLVKK